MRAPFVEHASGDQNRKSALVSGAVVETICTLCHISLSAYHRASPNVGWPRFRAVLMLTNSTCVSDRVEWHESVERNQSRRSGFPEGTLGPAKEFPSQNRPRVAPDIPPLLYRGDSYLTRTALRFGRCLLSSHVLLRSRFAHALRSLVSQRKRRAAAHNRVGCGKSSTWGRGCNRGSGQASHCPLCRAFADPGIVLDPRTAPMPEEHNPERVHQCMLCRTPHYDTFVS